jgi:hypothetical protein
MSLTVDDPPAVRACASCASPLHWLYSPRRQAWVAFVPVDPTTLRVHPCRSAQDPATWRSLRRGDPPNDEYLAVKAQLKERTEGDAS